jgi:hypothetical protein
MNQLSRELFPHLLQFSPYDRTSTILNTFPVAHCIACKIARFNTHGFLTLGVHEGTGAQQTSHFFANYETHIQLVHVSYNEVEFSQPSLK